MQQPAAPTGRGTAPELAGACKDGPGKGLSCCLTDLASGAGRVHGSTYVPLMLRPERHLVQSQRHVDLPGFGSTNRNGGRDVLTRPWAGPLSPVAAATQSQCQWQQELEVLLYGSSATSSLSCQAAHTYAVQGNGPATWNSNLVLASPTVTSRKCSRQSCAGREVSCSSPSANGKSVAVEAKAGESSLTSVHSESVDAMRLSRPSLSKHSICWSALPS